MNRRSIRHTVLAGLAVLATVAVGGVPASGATVYYAVAPLKRTTMVENPVGNPGSPRSAIVLTGMAKGEVRLLRAESVSDLGVPDRNALGQKITCERPNGEIVSQSWTGTNLLLAQGQHTIANRLVFVAPEAGTYVCRQRVYVDSHFLQPARARLLSGFIADVSGPVHAMRVAQARQRYGGMEFFPATDTSVHSVLPIDRFQIPPNGSLLTLRTDVFMTNCYGPGGAGCPVGTFPKIGGSSTFTMQAVLTPSNPGCPTLRSARITRTFDSFVHHKGESLDIATRVPASRCGSWSSRVEVRRVSGLPFVVQFAPYSQAFMYSR